VTTGEERGDVIPHVNGGTAGGSVAWAADGSGFFYTRYPREGERRAADLGFYQQVYFHKLGTPTAVDTYALGKEFPRIAETRLEASGDGRSILATVANGDGGEFEHFLLPPGGRWNQITHFADQVVRVYFARDGRTLYLLSCKDAPRGKVLRLRPGETAGAVSVLVPESNRAIVDVVPTDSRLYLVDVLGGPGGIRAVTRDGAEPVLVPVAPLSSVSEVIGLAGDEILFSSESYTSPPAWFRYSPRTSVQRTALASTSPADFGDVEVVRETAASLDGTSVPLTILQRKGLARDGRNPTILYGYGGFDVSLSPAFDPGRLVWLEQGGIYAIANLRGGGEFGEQWHRGGNLTHKQNVFDDFAACARRLIDAGYTSTARLGIEGGSNGGLLMGAALTQHPDLFRAVVSHVGIYDMMRFEQIPNGVFNVTEYGSVAEPEQFKALLAYSPYQHVVDGTKYPPVLLMSGTNDPRVNPADSRKMTARLQAATAGRPVLLRVSGGGHGIGSSLDERVGQALDSYSFFFAELGADYQPIGPAR
jgi:prolyl oligopeptidase